MDSNVQRRGSRGKRIRDPGVKQDPPDPTRRDALIAQQRREFGSQLLAAWQSVAGNRREQIETYTRALVRGRPRGVDRVPERQRVQLPPGRPYLAPALDAAVPGLTRRERHRQASREARQRLKTVRREGVMPTTDETPSAMS